MSTLAERIRDRSAKVGIIGLGYVGLPEAVMFAQAGYDVTGFDVDPVKVQTINAGSSYIADVQPRIVDRLVEEGRLKAKDIAKGGLAAQDCICICVPTPLAEDNKTPDVTCIGRATAAILKELHSGQLVILESSTYPGCTEDFVRGILESQGRKAGKDFHLAFSPERVDPGTLEHKPNRIPKVVGGYTPTCTALAASLYGTVVPQVVLVSSPAAAEMVKLLENTFRSVNIGLVNEWALICKGLGLDVWEIIDAAETKPFGFMAFRPGPGVGGHCFVPDTLVTMADGTERCIEDVRCGEYVLTGKGRPRRVLRVLSREYHGELVEIRVRGNPRGLLATPDHGIWVSRRHRTGSQNWKWDQEGWIQAGDVVPHTRRRASHALHQHSEPVGSGGDVNLARLLGLYLAEGATDGNGEDWKSRVRLSFGSNEEDLVSGTIELFRSVFGVQAKRRDLKAQHVIQVEVNDPAVVFHLERLGGILAWRKRLAPEVFGWSKEALTALWNGFVDGDGYRGVVVGAVTTSPQLARDLYRIVLLIGGSPSTTVWRHKGKRDAYYIRDRKRRMERDGHRLVDAVSSTRVPYDGVVMCLEVEEDHSFIAETVVVSNCIPIDPLYLSWKARQKDLPTRFIDLADEVNRFMPVYVVGLVERELKKRGVGLDEAGILVLGVAYKPNVSDARESPALEVIHLLQECGATVLYHDPFVESLNGDKSIPLDVEVVSAVDCVLILTNHGGVDYPMVARKARLVIDTRNALKRYQGKRDHIVKL